jgi:hypothetical protein
MTWLAVPTMVLALGAWYASRENAIGLVHALWCLIAAAGAAAAAGLA